MNNGLEQDCTVGGDYPRRGIKIAGLSQHGWIRAAFVAATVLALAPTMARAQQRIVLASGIHTGMVRVTAGGPDKKPVGIFDVEVSYDISRLASEIGHFTGGSIKVSSINGRIML